MNSIMVDNWLIQDIAVSTLNNTNQLSDNYAKFLSALILWDKIYYPMNEMSFGWSKLSTDTISGVLNSFSDFDYLFEEEALTLYNEFYKDEETRTIAQGAIRYLLLSNHLGLDYLPISERSNFLKTHNPQDIIKKIDRFDYISILDSSIEEHYQEFNRIFKRDIFRIQKPVLVDFIIQNTPKEMSYIDFALHLKNEGPVVQYRKYLSDIEDALEKREWYILNEMLKSSEEIVTKTVNMDRKSIGTITLDIVPVPAISFSKEFSLSRKKFHLSFLEDLTRFAFNGRKIL